jgi:hypothetical protein
MTLVVNAQLLRLVGCGVTRTAAKRFPKIVPTMIHVVTVFVHLVSRGVLRKSNALLPLIVVLLMMDVEIARHLSQDSLSVQLMAGVTELLSLVNWMMVVVIADVEMDSLYVHPPMLVWLNPFVALDQVIFVEDVSVKSADHLSTVEPPDNADKSMLIVLILMMDVVTVCVLLVWSGVQETGSVSPESSVQVVQLMMDVDHVFAVVPTLSTVPTQTHVWLCCHVGKLHSTVVLLSSDQDSVFVNQLVNVTQSQIVQVVRKSVAHARVQETRNSVPIKTDVSQLLHVVQVMMDVVHVPQHSQVLYSLMANVSTKSTFHSVKHTLPISKHALYVKQDMVLA